MKGNIKVYRINLKQINTENGLDVQGMCLRLPTKEQVFVMYTDPLEYGYSRQVITEPIKSIEFPYFAAGDSRYRLDVIAYEDLTHGDS